MSAQEVSGINDEADYDGPFVDYKEKGNKIELAGKEDVSGRPAFKLKLTSKANDVSYFYFDADSGLLMKWQGMRKVGDKEIPWETTFHDFREISGLKYPFLIESNTTEGTDVTQKITAQKIEVNPPLEDKQFDQAPPKPPTPALAGSSKPN